jgi:hypothetical protein
MLDPTEDGVKDDEHRSRRLDFGTLVTETDFSRLLRTGHENEKNCKCKVRDASQVTNFSVTFVCSY